MRTVAHKNRNEAGGPIVQGFRWVFIYPGLVIFLYLSVDSFLRTSYFSPELRNEVVWFRWNNIPVNLLILVGAVGLTALILNKKVAPILRRLPLEDVLACTMGLLGVCWVMMARIDPIGEALNVTATAESFLHHDYSAMEPGGYVHMFPFQLGYILFLELSYRIFGQGNILPAQLCNALALVVCYKALVRITHLLFEDEAITRAVCLLGFFSLYMVTFTTFIYGILLGMACGLVALWATLSFVRRHRWYLVPVAVIFSGLAVFFKPNALVFCIGVVLVLLLEALRERYWWYVLVAACVILAGFAAPKAVERMYEAKSGIELGDGVPSTAHLSMGLSDDGLFAPGWYNGATYELYRGNDYDTQVVDSLAKEVIFERLAVLAGDPLYAVRFFYTKTTSQWNEPTFGGMEITHSSLPDSYYVSNIIMRILEGTRLQALIVNLMAGYQMVVYCGVAFALWWKRKEWNMAQLLPLVIMLGGFAFHMFWEAKSQYVMPYFFLLAPYAAAGLIWLARGPVAAFSCWLRAGGKKVAI